MMPSKSQFITAGLVLVLLAAINRVDALEPVKDAING